MIQYINFDDQMLSTFSEGKSTNFTFTDAIAQGVTTQEYLEQQQNEILRFVLFDLEEAGYVDVTGEVKDTTSLYVFRDPNNSLLHHCKTVDEVFDLEEMGYVPNAKV